jgi:hypothetical protein
LSVLALSACSDSPAGLELSDDLLTVDVAMVAADGALEDLSVMGSLNQMGPGGVPRGGGGEFERSFSVTFLDVVGNEQTGFIEGETEAIRIEHSVSGEMSRDSWAAEISRSREVTISGFVTEVDRRIINGSGDEEVTRSRHTDEDGTRTYEMQGSLSIDDVVFLLPHSENPYPQSGTITREIHVEITNGPNGDEERDVVVTITFNGTSTATMIVNGEEFDLDLTARDGNRPFQRRQGAHL